MVTVLDYQSKVFTNAYQKNSNATIIDWIQDRGVVTVTEIVTDQEDNFVSHVEHWTSSSEFYYTKFQNIWSLLNHLANISNDDVLLFCANSFYYCTYLPK